MQAGPGPEHPLPPPIPPGGTGAAAELFDWARTPLGPRDGWPQSLKTAAGIVLGSNVPMALCWGPDLRLIHNDAYGEILGDRRPALGKPIKEVWSDAWARVERDVERIWAGETVFNEAAERPIKQGGVTRTAWLSVCYTPVRDEGGAVAGIFATVIGENQNAAEEQRLQESEERFRLIADSAPVPIWVTRLDRHRAFVNRAYLDFVGVDYDAALAFDWRTILHPEDAPRVLAESLAGEASLKTFALEARYRSGGEWRWLRSISQPRFGPGGEHVGFIGVAQDITEWKLGDEVWRKANERLEESVEARTADLRAALDRLQAEVGERERAEAALRQAQKMEAVGQLTGGIAHDFNNLLTPVIGGLEIISRSIEDPRLKRIADAALESGRRGAKLTSQLLAFSRIQRIRMVPVRVNKVIDAMRLMLKHSIGSAITIRTDLDPEADRALCDENQLENAILNLAINARDAMPDGGILTISTGVTSEPDGLDLAEGDYVCVAVSDTGQGMTAEVAARAIEPFFSTKPLGKGTGLGLAQVYGIVRQAGGTMRIESREGEGTTVRLLLPRALADAQEEAPGEGHSDAAGLAPGGGARIFVVDDDEDVREFLADALISLGHRVETMAGGAATLAALAQGAPDLILVDFAMPDMNGAELAREIRARLPDLPIVFVTGFAESDQLEGALGPDVPVLRKPFGIDDLATMVAAQLRS